MSTYNTDVIAWAEASESQMPRPKPPVFHVPVGHHRDATGEVVLFRDDAEQDRLVASWNKVVINHPATRAAGACVIIGPTMTTYLDLEAQQGVQSPTGAGAWQPAAIDDGPARRPA